MLRQALAKGAPWGAALTRPFASAADSASAALQTAGERDFMRYTSPVPSTFDHTEGLAGPPTKMTTLPSGLRVATETVPYATSATVGVWIDAGSRYESDATSGTAHFLEHMAFKGTTTRSLRQLEEEVENMGAHLNAYTSREQTTYYAKCLAADVPKNVELLADILQNSLLETASVEAEKGIIMREKEEVEKLPQEVLFDHLHATAFQHTPLGRSILGLSENIQNMTKADLQAYIKTHYSAGRMVVVGAGAVDHESFVKMAEKAFKSLPSTTLTTAQIAAAEPTAFTGSDVRFRDDDMGNCHLAIAVKGATWTDPDAVTLMVMQTMLGAWDEKSTAGVNVATPLGQRVAANRLAQSFSAFNTNYLDSGLFGVTAVSKGGEHLEDLVWSIMYEMTGLCYSVEEEDVTRAKNSLKSMMTLHVDGSSAIAEEIGRHTLCYGRRIDKVEMFARIDAVNADSVKACAYKFIHDKELAVVAMGQSQFVPDYNWIRRRTFWNRF